MRRQQTFYKRKLESRTYADATETDNVNIDISANDSTTTSPCLLVAADGRTRVIFHPINGFEDMFEVQLDRISNILRTLQQPRSVQDEADTPENRNDLKRTYSMSKEPPAIMSVDIDEESLVSFFMTRLHSVPLWYLRDTLPRWIGEMPFRAIYRSNKTPQWWPAEVPYKAASKLEKEYVYKLIVDLLLQHRTSDYSKREQDWTTTLREVTHVMAKGDYIPDALVDLRNQAMSEVFDKAKWHEDHVKEQLRNLNTLPREPVIVEQHDSPESETVSDSDTHGFTTRFDQRPQKKQRVPAVSTEAILLPQHNIANPTFYQTGYDHNTSSATGEHDGYTQSAGTAWPLPNLGPYAVEYIAASLDQEEKNTEDDLPTQTSFPHGPADPSNIKVSTLEPHVGHVSTDGAFAMHGHLPHEPNVVFNTMNEAYYNASVTFGNEAIPNEGSGQADYSFYSY